MSDQSATIRASEVGQHAFCARAWWLQHVQGVQSENVMEIAAGIAGHEAHGRKGAHAERLRRVAFALFVLATVVAGLLLLALRMPV